MMNRFFFIAIVASIGFLMFTACGHKYQGKLTPLLDSNTGKWGFADTLGKTVIPPQWDIANDFSEGLVAVGLHNQYGYIDENGIEVIPFKYDSIVNFSNNMARVSLNGKWGFIDKAGTEIIPIKYDEATPFFEGLSEVELDGKIGSIDTIGTIIVPFEYKELRFLTGSWGWSSTTFNTRSDDVLGLQNVGFTFKNLV